MSHFRGTVAATLASVFSMTLAWPALALPHALTADLYLLEHGRGAILRITPAGVVTEYLSRAAIDAVAAGSGVDFENRAIVFDAQGNMYFTEGVSRSILKRSTNGVITTLTTSATIAAATGELSANPRGVDIAADGFLYVTDDTSDSVLRVDPVSGSVSVFASKAALASAGAAAVPGFSSVSLKSSLAATPDGKIYVASDGYPDTIFELAPDGTPTVIASGLPPFDTTPLLFDLDLFMAVHPLTLDLVIGNDGSGGGGDDGHVGSGGQPDQFLYLRRGDGDLSVFLSEAILDALAATVVPGAVVDLEGGIAFDSSGNFYFGELNTGAIYKFTTALVGSVFVTPADIMAVTGRFPIFEGGMAFSPVIIPEPMTGVLGLLGGGAIMLSLRRRRA